MKKLYFLFASLSCLLFFAHNATAQSRLDSVKITASCSSTSNPDLFARFVIAPLATNTSLTCYYGDGTSSTQSAIASHWVYFNHTYATEGTYTVKAVLRVNGTPTDSASETVRAYCGLLRIHLYEDNNSNCVFDIGENHISHNFLSKKMEVRENGIVIDTITGYENTVVWAKKSTTYLLTLLNTPAGASATCPANRQISVTTPATSFDQAHYIGLQCTTSTQYDLWAKYWSNIFRPVGLSYMYIYAGNSQLCGSQSSTITLQIDPKYTYNNANITPSSISGNTVTWNLPAVNASSVLHGVNLSLSPATTVSLGDTVRNTVTISPTSNDINTSNNSFTQWDIVRASYDPNAKSVFPEGNFMPGDWFTYHIDFENLGNDTAVNIHILDTLSAHLNENSIEMLYSTHPMNHRLIKNGALNILKFEFPNIMLPDSNSKQWNKGYVEFKIRTKIGMPVLTKINNRASIYFDINPVIITNSTENIYVLKSVAETTNKEQIQVYPNPANDVLYIETNNRNYTSVKILNSIGQLITQLKLSKNISEVSTIQLAPGIYHLLVQGINECKAIKFQKN